MAKVKKFKGYVSDEPIVIELETPDGTSQKKFKCRKAVAGSTILDFLTDTSEDDPSGMAKAVFGLLQSAVEPGEWEGFRAFIDDPDNGITLEVLSEIGGWVAEQYAGRPTEPSVSSLPSS